MRDFRAVCEERKLPFFLSWNWCVGHIVICAEMCILTGDGFKK
jgi:hypothetical protein